MRLAIAALALSALMPLTAPAQTLSETEVRQMALDAVRDHPDLILQIILDNPEVVMQAVDILQAREEAEKAAAAREGLARVQDRLLDTSNAPVIGNPQGDVTVVEFFDYNCPYCKRAGEAVTAVLGADTNVRVIYREWPILGEASVFAAQAALAARKQGLYEPFHTALMTNPGRASEATVLRAARDVGLNVGKLRQDMESDEVRAHIQTSMELARALNFTGTPSFVVGDTLVPGFVEAGQLSQIIEQARQGG